MDLTISTLKLEAFLLVLARCAAFCATAPLFSYQSVNRRLRVLISACFAILIFTSMELTLPEYDSVLGFSLLLIKELLVGLSVGYISKFIMSMLVLAGEFIDREIGFSMVSNFDQSQGTNVTITAELYDKMVYLIMLITNLHFYIIQALAQTFISVPVGGASPNMPFLYTSVIDFIGQYFSVGFRIAMPIFVGSTMLNVILGILSKSSPQMNMFAVGMQMKVLCGLAVFSIMVMFVPNITNYLCDKMQYMVDTVIGGL